jgi:hypothetical protein
MRNTINQLKQDRPLIPKVVFAKSGTEDEVYFGIFITKESNAISLEFQDLHLQYSCLSSPYMLLIEEPTKFGQSYSQFLEMLNNEV